MSSVNLNWNSSRKIPLSAKGWKGFCEYVTDEFVENAVSSKSVYVIRLCPPFLLYYSDDEKSPVTYIGRGDFKQRITSHLKTWLNPLSKGLMNGYFTVLVTTPSDKKNVDFYKSVEADLLFDFEEKYSSLPLRNAKRESSRSENVYSKSDIKRAFGWGSGNHYHWAIWPEGQNKVHFRE